MKFKKISTQIILSIVLVSVVLSLTIIGISSQRSSRLLEEEAMKNVGLLTSANKEKLDLVLEKASSSVNGLSPVISGIVEKDRLGEAGYLDSVDQTISGIVEETASKTKALSLYFYFDPNLIGGSRNISFSSKDGKVVRNAQFPMEGFDKNDPGMDWFYKPIERKVSYWSDPYYWEPHKRDIVSYTIPVYSGDTLLGVMGADIDFSIFNNAINNISVYDTGYASLLSSELEFLVHPEYSIEDTLESVGLGDLASVVKSRALGTGEFKLEGKDEIVGYGELQNGQLILTVVPKSEVLQKANDMSNTLMAVAAGAILLSIGVGLVVGKLISKPILQVSGLAITTANLDLRYDDSYDNLLGRKDEIGKMANAFSEMRGSLRDLSLNLDEIVDKVSGDAKVLASTTEESSASIEELAASADELTSASNNQLDTTANGMERLSALANHIRETVEEADNVKDVISGVGESSKAGKESLEKLTERIQSTLSSTLMLVKDIDDLSKKSENIGDIIETIKSISNQTNLLALNASIEAARAGEAGRGFAVVAEEIRKLAEESEESTQSIRTIVEEMQKSICVVEREMNEASEVVESTSESSSEVSATFQEIEESVSRAAETTDLFIDRIMNIRGDKEALIESMEEIASVTKDNVSSTEEMSASIEEQTASMEEVSTMATELEAIAEKLKVEVDKITL